MSRQTREWIHILLTISTVLFVLSGMGVAEYNLMHVITFGLLTKDRSYVIHSWLLYPFTMLLFFHVYLALKSRAVKNQK
jgi:hypothetical protein